MAGAHVRDPDPAELLLHLPGCRQPRHLRRQGGEALLLLRHHQTVQSGRIVIGQGIGWHLFYEVHEVKIQFIFKASFSFLKLPDEVLNVAAVHQLGHGRGCVTPEAAAAAPSRST